MKEAHLVAAGEDMLHKICNDVQREYRIETTPYRVDLKGVLPNGEWALVEVKGFGSNLTPFVDAVFQAKSYADSIRYPVFIGPVFGNPSEIAQGSLTNALGAIHLMAGRMNVGFLVQPRYTSPMLMLRGQIVVDANGPRENFSSLWGYLDRRGSKTVLS